MRDIFIAENPDIRMAAITSARELGLSGRSELQTHINTAYSTALAALTPEVAQEIEERSKQEKLAKKHEREASTATITPAAVDSASRKAYVAHHPCKSC